MSSRWRRVLLGGVASLALGGCKLPTIPSGDQALAANNCPAGASEGACGPGGAGICLRGICQAAAADPSLAEYRFEISSSLLDASNTQPGQRLFVRDAPKTPAMIQISQPYIFRLPSTTTVDIDVPGADPTTNAPIKSVSGCTWQTSPATPFDVPVHATLLASEDDDGLPTTSYGADWSADFHTRIPDVPEGTYSLYLQPDDDATCAIPPFLLRGIVISYPGPTFPEKVQPGQPDTLSGEFDTAAELGGWTVDIVDKLSGLRLSTVGALTDTSPTAHSFGPLEYYPPQSVAGSPFVDTSYLLRLSPPASVVAPTFAFDVPASDPFDTHEVAISLDQSIAFSLGTVSLSSRLEQLSSTDGVVGHVVLQSRSLTTLGGGLSDEASLVIETGTAADGTFPLSDQQLPILPGIYDVYADTAGQTTLDSPSGINSLGLAHAVFDIPTSTPVVAGMVVSFAPRSSLIGELLAPSGQALPSVPLGFSPLPIAPAVPALGRAAVSPHEATTLTAVDGSFSVGLDGPSYDVTAQLDPATGLPWLVKPGVSLASLGRAQLVPSLPIELSGTVDHGTATGLSSHPLVSGTLRAYARGPAAGSAWILVAESPIDEAGGYSLLLPSSL